jgi:hypothetical protein
MKAAEARRILELQRKFEQERTKRLAAEQRAAGLRSAVLRMQAMLARQKAEDAERRATLHAE